jgi:hypothetical protein
VGFEFMCLEQKSILLALHKNTESRSRGKYVFELRVFAIYIASLDEIPKVVRSLTKTVFFLWRYSPNLGLGLPP